jgi:hypothetical protein
MTRRKRIVVSGVLAVTCGTVAFSLGYGARRQAAHDRATIAPAAYATATTSASPPQRPRLDVDPSTAERRIRADVEYLASNELGGRGPYTHGIDLAANYIARQFGDAGLDIGQFDGTPFQAFSNFTEPALGAGNKLAIVAAQNQRLELTLAVDFTPLSISPASDFDLPLVFAGYGIHAPQLGYDDFEAIDVAGKAVIVLRHEPQQADPSSVFDGTRNSPHAFLARKIANATQRGAKAIILCNDGAMMVRFEQPADPTSPAGAVDADQLMDFDVRGHLPKQPIPIIQCRREILDRLLTTAGAGGLSELEQRIDLTLQPASCELGGCHIAGQVSIEQKLGALKNVVAVLEGAGPTADETIVLGAHYDHLGMGGFGTLAPWTVAVHNGADDNASGTAVLLEIARRLAARAQPLPRRLIFIAFSAEEMGLIGSEHYVSRPLVPMQQTVAMLNLDMVGRLRNDELTVSGTGTGAEFESAVGRLGQQYGFRISSSPSGYGPSDHTSFYSHGVPVLHFFTGLHEDYHRPSDDFDKLNYTGMLRVTDMVHDLAVELATAETPPQRRSEGLLTSFTPPSSPTSPSDSRSNPRSSGDRAASLGLSVRPADGRSGFVVAHVANHGLAAQAGLRPGDIILEIGSQPIGSVDELSGSIRSRKMEKSLPILIRRGGLELEVEFAAAHEQRSR